MVYLDSMTATVTKNKLPGGKCELPYHVSRESKSNFCKFDLLSRQLLQIFCNLYHYNKAITEYFN